MLLTGSLIFLNTRLSLVKYVKFYSCAVTHSKDIPTKGMPIIGSLFSFIASGSSPKLHLYIDAKHKELGPVFREIMPSRNTIFLSDSDKIRQVFALEGKCPVHFLPESWLLYNETFGRKRGLLFMEGEEWLHYRKIMNHFLLKEDVTTELAKVYDKIGDSLLTHWSKFIGKKLHNLDHDMYKHSISFMLATTMGSSYVDQESLFKEDLERLAKSYQKIFETTSKLMIVPVGLVSKLNLPVWKHFISAMDESLNLSESVIIKAKKSMSKDGLLYKLIASGISERMASVLLTDLMIAAGDTTAYTLQWALYLLGKDVVLQGKVKENSTLIRGVIKETLRLYPAAPFLTRIIQQPLEVSGYNIAAGELIVMSMYTSSRLESNFPKATEFNPQRWTRTSEGQVEGVLKTFASLPFSMGARSCVGKKLAETLMILTIKKILTKFKVITLKDVDMILRLTPAPSEKIPIMLESQ